MAAAVLGAGALAAGGSIGGSMLASSGAKKQTAAMMKQIEESKRQYEANVARLQPYTEFGGEQLNALRGFLTDPTKQPMNYLDPAYEFRRKAGLSAVEGSAAGSGMLKSGDTLRALEGYGQDLASQEYGNAFNRWLSEGQFRQNLAGMGQSAAAGQGYLSNQGLSNIGAMTQNIGLDQSDRLLGSGVAGAGGAIGNSLARYYAGNAGSTPTTPALSGGSNIFGSNITQQQRLGIPDYTYTPGSFR
jgi:hypothetical protein